MKNQQFQGGQVFVISDLHLGHSKITEFEGTPREGSNTAEHDEILKEKWHSVIKSKRQLVWVLGDVAFNKPAMIDFSTWTGKKYLTRGNHDGLPEHFYRNTFERVFGIVKNRRHWLSHAPVHPQELRGCRNIHGHIHHKSLQENPVHEPTGLPAYVNVCVESTGGYPVDLFAIINGEWEPQY